MNLPTGYKLKNRYEIENRLSEQGGFGITYKACDRFFLRDCIIKQLRLKNSVAKRLFESEYKHLFTLNSHPQVPNLLDFFEEQAEYYLVQEFIDGHDLSTEICHGKSLSEKQTVFLVKEILEILVPVHKIGLIHRDIKPQNIMRKKSNNKLILIDFGAVKKVTSTYLKNNQLTVCVGTEGYMPQEQKDYRPILASDIYAVGIIGIFALLGIHPNQLPKSQTGKILWRDRVQINPKFTSILDKMIDCESSKRYPNAIEALRDIHYKLPELSRYYLDEDLDLAINLDSSLVNISEQRSTKNLDTKEKKDFWQNTIKVIKWLFYS